MKAFVAGCLALLVPLLADAHAAPLGDGAEVRIDKAEQRRLGIRTQRADAPAPPQWWAARGVADPQAGVVLTAGQDGVLEVPPGGFATPGQAVRAGTLLARLRPMLGEAQRRDIEAELAQAERDVALGRLQIARYQIDEAQDIEVQLLTNSIQILIDYRAAQERVRQLRRALDGEIELRAPRDGVVLRSRARAGRVVGGGETIFELLGGGVLIETVAEEVPAVPQALARFSGSATLLPLVRRSASFEPRLRAWRLLYAPPPAGALLPAIGQPLQLSVATAGGSCAVPVTSLFHERGRDWVWVHTAAERFTARAVSLSAGDGAWRRIDGGLQADERIVVDAASVARAARSEGGS